MDDFLLIILFNRVLYYEMKRLV